MAKPGPGHTVGQEPGIPVRGHIHQLCREIRISCRACRKQDQPELSCDLEGLLQRIAVEGQDILAVEGDALVTGPPFHG